MSANRAHLILSLTHWFCYGKQMGDRTNLVMILAGELLRKAEYLLTMGLHPSEVVLGYELARDRAMEELESEFATTKTPHRHLTGLTLLGRASRTVLQNLGNASNGGELTTGSAAVFGIEAIWFRGFVGQACCRGCPCRDAERPQKRECKGCPSQSPFTEPSHFTSSSMWIMCEWSRLWVEDLDRVVSSAEWCLDGNRRVLC